MDARIDPQDAFGLEFGDAHVLRNAGAVVTDDVLRSLVLSQRLLQTRSIAVMAHTECGRGTMEKIVKALEENAKIENPLRMMGTRMSVQMMPRQTTGPAAKPAAPKPPKPAEAAPAAKAAVAAPATAPEPKAKAGEPPAATT